MAAGLLALPFILRRRKKETEMAVPMREGEGGDEEKSG